tara:strand:- start:4822 stop:5073 length:252 start_codon:yes stop_codon:yes gene_type:complete
MAESKKVSINLVGVTTVNIANPQASMQPGSKPGMGMKGPGKDVKGGMKGMKGGKMVKIKSKVTKSKTPAKKPSKPSKGKGGKG